VQTGLTLNKTLAILSNLRIQLFLLITVGLFVSSIGGHFMSRKALKPWPLWRRGAPDQRSQSRYPSAGAQRKG